MTRRQSRMAGALWWFMLLSCIGVSVYATRYFLWRPSDDHSSRYLLALRLRIAGGIDAPLVDTRHRQPAVDEDAAYDPKGPMAIFRRVAGACSQPALAGALSARIRGGFRHCHGGLVHLSPLRYLGPIVVSYKPTAVMQSGSMVAHPQCMIRNFVLTRGAVRDFLDPK